jgi:hypothetical protein
VVCGRSGLAGLLERTRRDGGSGARLMAPPGAASCLTLPGVARRPAAWTQDGAPIPSGTRWSAAEHGRRCAGLSLAFVPVPTGPGG